MIQFLLAAPRSGSGKTTMTCALLMALKRRGCAPCAFKSGPDYIDPMFSAATVETSVDGNVVGLRQGKILATAFHPELTDDTRIHELFLSL